MRIARGVLGVVFAFAGAVASSTALAYPPVVELTFDDGPDRSGPATGHAYLQNVQEYIAEVVSPTLVGGAHRGTLGSGRYGRAAELAGGYDAVVLETHPASPGAPPTAGQAEALVLLDPTSDSLRSVHLWLRRDSAAPGWVLLWPGALGLRVSDAGLSVVVRTGAGESTLPVGLGVPRDGVYHHLDLVLDGRGAGVLLGVRLDFGESRAVRVGEPAATGLPLTLGLGLDGAIDELLLASSREYFGDERLDRDPAFCGDASLVCGEGTLAMTPPGLGWPVPVRFKLIVDPARCNPATPCPLLMETSGGGLCADDYSWVAPALAKDGFVVVTTDLYCEGRPEYRFLEAEPAQLRAVKDLVQSLPAVASLVTGEGYLASGCSHGAVLTMAWALREDDHPARVFVRSPALDLDGSYHAGELCDLDRTLLDHYIVGASGSPHAHDTEPGARFAEDFDFLSWVTPDVVASRALGVVWGAASDPSAPTCTAEGVPLCVEETWYARGGRRFRDAWQALEGEAGQSLFLENTERPCEHCITPENPAWEELVLFLHAGAATEGPRDGGADGEGGGESGDAGGARSVADAAGDGGAPSPERAAARGVPGGRGCAGGGAPIAALASLGLLRRRSRSTRTRTRLGTTKDRW